MSAATRPRRRSHRERDREAAAAIVTNRAAVDWYSEERLRDELAWRFHDRRAIAAGIDAYRKARTQLRGTT